MPKTIYVVIAQVNGVQSVNGYWFLALAAFDAQEDARSYAEAVEKSGDYGTFEDPDKENIYDIDIESIRLHAGPFEYVSKGKVY